MSSTILPLDKKFFSWNSHQLVSRESHDLSRWKILNFTNSTHAKRAMQAASSVSHTYDILKLSSKRSKRKKVEYHIKQHRLGTSSCIIISRERAIYKF